MVTACLSILNQMEFHFVQNRKENGHHDQIPFNVKGNGNIVFSLHVEIIGAINDVWSTFSLDIVTTLFFQTFYGYFAPQRL